MSRLLRPSLAAYRSIPEVISLRQSKAIQAQAEMHHAYFLGLQLAAAAELSKPQMEEWMFRLFRRQHEEKFLSSFEKLDLLDLPHAVACAKYHVLSNSIGGVAVEYMYEHDRKAWVRFRYPRWMYHGPVICGIPIEVSRGFLRGWYGHNGVSLGNPRLGFVCVSEDMTGEFGLCGYFREYDEDLSPENRLRFAQGEQPPPFVASEQPLPPSAQWNEERLLKAARNYAMDYVRNGINELVAVAGSELAEQLASRSAKLIGLQYLRETLAMSGAEDGSLAMAADYLGFMFSGLGDGVEIDATNPDSIIIRQSDLRILRGLNAESCESQLLLRAWQQLWLGALGSFRQRKTATIRVEGSQLVWNLREV